MAASVSAGVALLRRAVGFALICASDVTPGKLANPTPCDSWDLRALLAHLSDSALVLRESIGAGCISPLAIADTGSDFRPRRRQDPAATFRAEARMLLGACALAGSQRQVALGDRHLGIDIVAATGAIELAVHGWDISMACGGGGRPIPPVLFGGPPHAPARRCVAGQGGGGDARRRPRAPRAPPPRRAVPLDPPRPADHLP